MEILNSYASFLCPVVAIRLVRDNKQMRPLGIEPGLEAWEATIIPLDYGRTSTASLLNEIATPASLAPLQWAKSMVESISEERAPYCRWHVYCVESGQGGEVADGAGVWLFDEGGQG